MIQRSKTLKKIICFSLISSMLFTGCEKKAGSIEGIDEVDSSNTSLENTDDKESTTVADNVPESNNEDDLKFEDAFSGGSEGYGSVNVNVTLEDHSAENLYTYTVQVDEFDKDFIHSMCDAVFDSGEVEVYDFNHATKRVYEDKLDIYNDSLEFYDFSEKQEHSYPVTYKYCYTDNNFFTEEPYNGEFSRAVIENDIDYLEQKMNDAPENIENDYSYQGYIGKIDGEEYYMYFGNRGFDEYYSSPVTYQINGRVISIIKKDLESSYNGSKLSDYNISDPNGNKVEYMPTDLKAIFTEDIYHRVATITPDSDITTEESPAVSFYGQGLDKLEIDDSYISEGEQFISKLGFSNYIYDENPKNLGWYSGIDEGFLYIKDYHMMKPHEFKMQDGYVLRYCFNNMANFIEDNNVNSIPFHMYDFMNGKDPYNYISYIDVMINESGVIGCQIYNPIKLIKSDPIDKIIDNDALKKTVEYSVDNKDLWNYSDKTEFDSFSLDKYRFITFPIRSSNNMNEYIYTPCILLYGVSLSRVSYTPFLLINAVDGSCIKVDKELSDYPMGWNNGNVGEETLNSGLWKRYILDSE